MQPREHEHSTRIGITCVLAIIAEVIALTTLFLALTLVFFANWALDSTKLGCPVAWGVLYLNRIKIIEVVFTVFLALWTVCLFILAGLAFKHKIDIKYSSNSPTQYRTAYPLFISLALISAIVCLLKIIKIYTSIAQIRDLNDNGQIPATCLTSSQYNGLVNKMNPAIIVLVLIAIMILLTVLVFVALPYRYFVMQLPQEHQVYQPLSRTQRVKPNQGRKLNKFQISHQQLLEQPVMPKKTYQSIAVGDDERVFLREQKKVQQRKIEPPKSYSSIGVGGDLLTKKADIGVNSIKVQTRDSMVGDHIEFRDQKTDCEGLIEQKQIKLTTPRIIRQTEQITIQEDYNPKRDGYYYLSPHPSHISQSLEAKSTRKLESMLSSGKKLIENPLRASKGSRYVDQSHENMLKVGQKLNYIYTPTNKKQTGPHQKSGYRSSEKKWKSNLGEK